MRAQIALAVKIFPPFIGGGLGWELVMLLKPDYNLENVYKINFEDLRQQGVKCLMFDLDSTVMVSKSGRFTKETLDWFNTFLNDFEVVNKYYNYLVEYNSHTNLTTIIEKEDVYLKHFYDSLTVIKAIDLNNVKTIVDIGSGAGFPGIVLKIFFW